MKNLYMIAAFAVTAILLVPAKSEDLLYVKNQWRFRIYINVNGSWQGYVNPGKTVYMPQEGFVTLDSGFQDNGELKMTHSYGGWPIRKDLLIFAISSIHRDGDEEYVFVAEEYAPYSSTKAWSFGDESKTELSPPEGVELEWAEKMQRGSPPLDAFELLRENNPESVVSDSGKEINGLINSKKERFKLLMGKRVVRERVPKRLLPEIILPPEVPIVPFINPTPRPEPDGPAEPQAPFPPSPVPIVKKLKLADVAGDYSFTVGEGSEVKVVLKADGTYTSTHYMNGVVTMELSLQLLDREFEEQQTTVFRGKGKFIRYYPGQSPQVRDDHESSVWLQWSKEGKPVIGRGLQENE